MRWQIAEVEMRKTAFLLCFLCAFGAQAQGYPYSETGYPASYAPDSFAVPRRNPYRGGIGMVAMEQAAPPAAQKKRAAGGKRAASVRRNGAVHKPASIEKNTKAKAAVKNDAGYQTRAFSDYLKNNPDVMPDIKMAGEYEW